MSLVCGQPDTFMTLPGTLPFKNSDLSDFEDFLTVPQHRNDFSLSSASSLDATDLFLQDLRFEGSSESTSSFTSPASNESSRLEDLTSDFPLPLGDLEQQVEQAPVPAPLPLGTHGLKLKLDFNSVLSAWHGVSGGAHPFQLRGPQLLSAASTIPSTADLAASITASMPGLPTAGAGSAAESGAVAAAAAQQGAAMATAIARQLAVPQGQAQEEARRQELAAAAAQQRQRDRKAGRKSSERKVMYAARKVNADKRPRIKGRFVTKAEFEQLMSVQAEDDRIVPGMLCCA